MNSNMTSDASQAFNMGCDARIAGLPLNANPHNSANEDLRDSWRHGWWDVERHWGMDSICPVLRLPAIPTEGAA